MFKRVFLLVAVLVFSSASLDAMTYRRTEVHHDEDDDGVYEEDEVWFGPGFYFGVWFDDEDDYRHWRRDHRHYPAHQRNYHRDGHRDEHHREDHHDGHRGGGGHGHHK